LLRAVRIPDDLEKEAIDLLSSLDAKLIAADPRLAQLAAVIGEATHIAIGEGPGAARLNTLPLSIEEMLQRTGVVLRNEDLRPWLPLGHHGQGLQSLAVIFLFQAAVLQQLRESTRTGMDAIFAIEEPEAHLHPQAARTLWSRIRTLPGQSLVTTHSPYFVQNVALHDLKVVRLSNGRTTVASIPRFIASDLPWNAGVERLAAANHNIVTADPAGRVRANSWLHARFTESLEGCYRHDADHAQKAVNIATLRHDCRILISPHDESDLSFHGRRIRGEIFFARRWILVEGVCEYLLINAIAAAMQWPLDAHGVSVIDFQNCGSPGVYVALAEALQIPWHMIADGDAAGDDFYEQIVGRGFLPTDLVSRFDRLPTPNGLEDQLIADGNEILLREIMSKEFARAGNSDFSAWLKNRKTDYMTRLAPRVASDLTLAKKMPGPFVQLVTALVEGRA
jgi:putative ATP-dependent endonuclease of OLD family